MKIGRVFNQPRDTFINTGAGRDTRYNIIVLFFGIGSVEYITERRSDCRLNRPRIGRKYIEW